MSSPANCLHAGVEIDASTVVGSFAVTARFRAGPGITALFGPSGSGKSVTLAAIAGLLRPRAGTIRLGSVVVADTVSGIHMRTQDRHVGVVFQQATLLHHRSPLDNVALAVRESVGRSGRREVAARWLERVGARDLAHSPTRSLSGGEQQRVALARALAGSPRVLLLDEPFSALDAATRTALRDLVRSVVDEHGITALLVTHDVEDVRHLADRIVRFAPGRTLDTVQFGDTERHDAALLAAALGFAS